jgi:Protein of unknown function (DUF2958)
MELITEELIEIMNSYPIKSQAEETDPMILVKFFNPCGSQSWYISEYDPEHKEAFGYVTGMYQDEFGYVSIEELQSIKLPFGLTIERDLYFKPCKLSECSTFVPAE